MYRYIAGKISQLSCSFRGSRLSWSGIVAMDSRFLSSESRGSSLVARAYYTTRVLVVLVVQSFWYIKVGFVLSVRHL
jgi:hypothetical protein